MTTDMGFAATRSRIKLEERVLQVLVNLHDRSLVAASVTVVGRTEDGHHIPVLTPVVALQSNDKISEKGC